MNKYHYIDSTQKQCGPFTAYELKLQNISPETLVWCSGMPDWTEAKSVDELRFLFDAGATPPVHSMPTPSQTMFNPNSQAYQSQNVRSALDNTLPIPKTWLVESILVTVLCCMPFGIVGLLSANKVETRYYAGDYEGAMQASKDAAKWVKWGFGLTAVGIVLYILFFVVLAVISGGSAFDY